MARRCTVHQLGNDKGVDPVLSLFIDGAVIVIRRTDAAACGAQDDAGPVRKLLGKVQP